MCMRVSPLRSQMSMQFVLPEQNEHLETGRCTMITICRWVRRPRPTTATLTSHPACTNSAVRQRPENCWNRTRVVPRLAPVEGGPCRKSSLRFAGGTADDVTKTCINSPRWPRCGQAPLCDLRLPPIPASRTALRDLGVAGVKGAPTPFRVHNTRHYPAATPPQLCDEQPGPTTAVVVAS